MLIDLVISLLGFYSKKIISSKEDVYMKMFMVLPDQTLDITQGE